MNSNKDLKIVLFGDAPMAVNEGGVPQTLYNLFSFIEPDNFLGITAVSDAELKKIGPKYQHRYIRYKYKWITVPFNNRFTKYFTPVTWWINYSLVQLSRHRKVKKAIADFNPDIIIACSNSPIGIAAHSKLFLGKLKGRVIPYFMDDWMNGDKANWLGGSIYETTGQILKESQYWIMISKELSAILQERYNVKPVDTLCIHNPVDISQAPPINPYKKSKTFTITYAGSLWPMHYDSFYAFAKAVSLLKDKLNIRLKLFSPVTFWDWRKAELEPLGVVFGGHLDYKDVHKELNKADSLLLTSSFEKEFYTHSKASIQTKITDYCLSRRLIISCGPQYSANHNFIKENNCGICIETTDCNEIASKISEIVTDIDNYQNLVENGWQLLRDFSKPVVHQKIKDYMNTIDSSVKKKTFAE